MRCEPHGQLRGPHEQSYIILLPEVRCAVTSAVLLRRVPEKISTVMARLLFISIGLLVFATAALAGGTYQRTTNGKTTVWNNAPKPGDEAAWSGDRDDEGYASGFGTLTWYTTREEDGDTKSTVYAHYFGRMVRGKFDGPVNAHAKGKTNHALFADGVRTSRWAAGAAPSRRLAKSRVELVKVEKIAAEPPAPKPSHAAEPEAPAEGPREIRKAEKNQVSEPQTASKSDSEDQKKPASAVLVKQPPRKKKSQTEVEQSLRALVAPPSGLGRNPDGDILPEVAPPEAATLPAADARLTKEEIVDLADKEARTRGYNPAEYERAEPQYNSADAIWSVSYDQPAIGMAETSKRFSITIDDKTKGTIFVPGK